MKGKIIKECYNRSVKLLIQNSNAYGITAATHTAKAIDKRYDYIFGRDASICVLGMVASGDRRLLNIAKKSLVNLAQHQTKLGEIPYSCAPSHQKSLFYFLGSIDSTIWWLIALDFYDKYAGDKSLKKKLEVNIKKAFKWLHYQDQNNCGLLEQGEASDWADDMPSNGMVLYTNVLWYRVLKLYGTVAEQELALDGLNSIFLPHHANPSRSQYIAREIHRLKEFNIIKESVDNVPYYLHYISYKYASDRLDVYANSLAIIFGVAQQARIQAIIRYFRNKKVSRKYPVQVLLPPIEPDDNDWREFMDREDCANKPLSYHNGGIWPYIGSFYCMALHKAGKQKLAQEELRRVAQANRLNEWEFNEWLHGKSGQPMGMIGQSWNAGAFLLAYHYLQGDIDI